MAKAPRKAAKKKAPEGTAPRTLTLLSWNVNGVRAMARKGFVEWLEKAGPDVLGLQETKAHPEQLSKEMLMPAGYKTVYNPADRKGYSGTALFFRSEPDDVRTGLGSKEYDGEGRVIFADFPAFTFVTVYIPNGRSDLSRVPFKLGYSDALLEVCEDLRAKGRPLILCGDFNTAHKEIDLARPKDNRKSTGFLPEERAWLDKFTSMGYTDSFRILHPDRAGAYSWWDYRTRARPRNVGWRLDYFFVTSDLVKNVQDAFILSDVMGSDHAPVGIELDLSGK